MDPNLVIATRVINNISVETDGVDNVVELLDAVPNSSFLATSGKLNYVLYNVETRVDDLECDLCIGETRHVVSGQGEIAGYRFLGIFSQLRSITLQGRNFLRELIKASTSECIHPINSCSNVSHSRAHAGLDLL